MKLSAKNNPFFAQQVDTSRFPSFRVTLLGGLALGVLMVALEAAMYVLYSRLRARFLLFFFLNSLTFIQMAPVFLMPILASIAAGRIWHAHSEGGQGEPMTAQQTITGLILSVFYRLRVLVAMMLIAIPIMVIGNGIGRAVLSGTIFLPAAQSGWQAIVAGLVEQKDDAVFLVQLAGLFIMGGAIGAVLAVKIARPWVSAASAFLLTIILWPTYLVVARSVPRLFSGWASGVGFDVLLAGIVGLLWLIPLGIAWAASRLAHRWV